MVKTPWLPHSDRVPRQHKVEKESDKHVHCYISAQYSQNIRCSPSTAPKRRKGSHNQRDDRQRNRCEKQQIEITHRRYALCEKVPHTVRLPRQDSSLAPQAASDAGRFVAFDSRAFTAKSYRSSA